MTLLAKPSAQVRTCTCGVSTDFASFEKGFHNRDPETQKYLLCKVPKVQRSYVTFRFFQRVQSFHTAGQFYLTTSTEEHEAGSRRPSYRWNS